MRRFISVFALLTLLLSLAACGGGKPEETDAGSTETEAPVAQIGENDIVVSPDGNDAASGTEADPLATIGAAKEMVKTREGNEKLTVWIKEGVYYLSDMLNFDDTDRANVDYKAYGEGESVISGGQVITGWAETEINGVTAWVADIKNGANFKTLSDKNGMLPLARYPEEGYLRITGYCAADVTNPESGYGQHMLAFVTKPENVETFSNLNSVYVRMLHTWIDEYIPVDSINTETGEVWMKWRTGRSAAVEDRFYFENVYEALDKPGEWCYDEASAKVYYVPREGETLEGFELYAGKINGLMAFNGAKNITFAGITFTGTDYDLTQTSYGFGGWSPAAITGDNCENLVFDKCTFRSLGSGGVSLCSRTVGCRITNCTFRDIGAVPIQQHGTYSPSEYDNTPLNAVISNNLIDGFGRVYNSCCGILSYNANGVEISHNEVCNGYDSGIHVTCTGDLANDLRVGDISILNNYVHDIGFGVLNDFGGIYTCGRQPGTVIAGNVIRDIHGAGSTTKDYDDLDSHGIYLDMFSSEMEVCNNLVYDCNGWGITYDCADLDVDVHNNIFAYCGGGVGAGFYINAPRGLMSKISNNIFLLENGPMFVKEAADHKENIEEHNNLYYYQNSEEQISAEDAFYTDPIIADPLFADPENRDFTLSENSPAVKHGFEIWDYSSAGRK